MYSPNPVPFRNCRPVAIHCPGNIPLGLNICPFGSGWSPQGFRGGNGPYSIVRQNVNDLLSPAVCLVFSGNTREPPPIAPCFRPLVRGTSVMTCGM